MKKIIGLLLLCSIVVSSLSVVTFAADETAGIKTLAQTMTFDDMTALKMLQAGGFDANRKVNFCYSAQYDFFADGTQTPKTELSSEFDHTTGTGKSLKIYSTLAAWNGKYNEGRVKFFNTFKDSALTSEDSGKKFTITFWAYVPKDTQISSCIMSVANISGVMTGSVAYGGQAYESGVSSWTATRRFDIPAGTWTKCQYSYTLDDVNVNDVYQVGMLTIGLPEGNGSEVVAYIDDVNVTEGEAPVDTKPEISNITTNTTTDASSADIEKYGEANLHTKNLLTTLGILTEFFDKFDQTKVVTRGEFAGVLCQFLNTKIKESDSQLLFDDISSSPYKSEISTLGRLGIMIGCDEHTFNPDATIDFNGAITAMVRFLNYTLYAESNGGYTIGYQSVAVSKGLSKGIDVAGTDQLTQGTLMDLLTNFIDIDVLEQIGYGDKVSYQTTKGYTVLAQWFNVYKDKGVVTANSDTSLASPQGVSDKLVKINNVAFEKGDSTIDQYLGYDTVFYYRYSDESESTVVYAYKSQKNVVTEVDAADISGLEGSKFVYYEDESERYQIITGDESYIINGISAVPSSLDFLVEDGKITFVDNNNDGANDVIFIDKIDYYVVSAADANGTIFDKYRSEPLVIDVGSPEVVYSIKDTSGKDIAIDALKEWDVLSVKAAEGIRKQKYEIIVSRYTAKGTIDECSTKGDGTYESFTMGGTEIKASNTLNNFIFNLGLMNEITVGSAVTLYLNDVGNVVAWAPSSQRNFQIGYLLGCITGTGLNKNVSIRVLTPSNTFVSYQLADKVALNGETVKYSDAAIMTALMEGGDVKRQVICYKINDDGNVSFIETAETGTFPENNNRLHRTASTGLNYIGGGNMFTEYVNDGSSYIVNTGAVGFKVPVSNEFLDRDEFYKGYTDAAGIVGSNPTFQCTLYTYGDMYNFVDVVVVSTDSTTLTSTNSEMVVKETSRGLDANGDEVLIVSGFVGGGEFKTHILDSRTAANKREITVGDVIYCPVSTKTPVLLEDNISSVKFYSDFKPATGEVELVTRRLTNYGADQSGLWTPYALKNGYILFNNSSSPASKEPLNAFKASAFKIYYYDSKAGVLKQGTISDVKFYSALSAGEEASPCYVSISGGKPNFMII